MDGKEYLEIGVDLIVLKLRDTEFSHARICKAHAHRSVLSLGLNLHRSDYRRALDLPREVLLDVLKVSRRSLFSDHPFTPFPLLPYLDSFALSKEDLPEEVSESSNRQRARLEGIVRGPKFPDYASGFVDSGGNKHGIGSMDRVEVITLEETDRVGFGKLVEERNEPALIVNLNYGQENN